MEGITVKINSPEDFDHSAHGCEHTPALSEGGDLAIYTKNGALTSGRAGAVITFTVDVGGKLMRAQAVTTVKLLKAALAILDGSYDDNGMPRSGHH